MSNQVLQRILYSKEQLLQLGEKPIPQFVVNRARFLARKAGCLPYRGGVSRVRRRRRIKRQKEEPIRPCSAPDRGMYGHKLSEKAWVDRVNKSMDFIKNVWFERNLPAAQASPMARRPGYLHSKKGGTTTVYVYAHECVDPSRIQAGWLAIYRSRRGSGYVPSSGDEHIYWLRKALDNAPTDAQWRSKLLKQPHRPVSAQVEQLSPVRRDFTTKWIPLSSPRAIHATAYTDVKSVDGYIYTQAPGGQTSSAIVAEQSIKWKTVRKRGGWDVSVPTE
jgi:hypothetical protein